MRIRTLVSIGCAVLVSVMAVPAFAYFTDNSRATGSLTVSFVPVVTVDEEYENGVKTVVIHNDENSGTDVFVRARVFASSDLNAEVSWENDAWEADGDWYVYRDVLPKGSDTSKLLVEIPKLRVVPAESAFDNLESGHDYNVIVIWEAVPVQYDEYGKAFADWDMRRDGDVS